MIITNKSKITVVIPEKATPRELFAAQELEKYLNSNRLFFREFAKSELDALSLANSEVVPTEITEFWI